LEQLQKYIDFLASNAVGSTNSLFFEKTILKSFENFMASDDKWYFYHSPRNYVFYFRDAALATLFKLNC
jgi:hypothetical protein